MLRAPRTAWLPLLAVLVTLAPAARTRRARDLDVAIPPGSALAWGDAFPVTRPFRPLVRRESGRERSRSQGRFEPRAASAHGMVRITTWDLRNYLRWVGMVASEGSTSRRSRLEPHPEGGDGRYWVSLAPFLRTLLHPARVLEPEVVAHLVELGEPVREVLPVVRSEGALRGLASRVGELLGEEAAGRVDPGAGTWASPAEGARQGMLARFVLEELLAHEPYDPEDAFGERLSYLAEEALPALVRYAEHPELPVRRRAVAALGRYRSGAERVLVRLAGRSADPVVRLRAIAALGRVGTRHDVVPLVAVLAEAREPYVIVALAHLMGRLRVPESAPVLLEQARTAADRRREALPALLAALAAVPLGAEREEVLEFAERLGRKARSEPRSFRSGQGSFPQVDQKDPVQARGILVDQLCAIVLLRQGKRDEDVRRRFLHAHRPREHAMLRTSSLLASIEPRARGLYVSSLSLLGAEGDGLLTAIADDPSVDPELRVLALRDLTWEQREARLTGRVHFPREGWGVELSLLEMVAHDPSPSWASWMRPLLAAWGDQAPGRAPLEVRSLAQVALVWLEDHGHLEWSDVERLLPQLGAPHLAQHEAYEELRAEIARWVREAREARSVKGLEEAVREAVERAARLGLVSLSGEEAREERVEYCLAQLASVGTNRGQPGFERLVQDTLLERLAGHAPLRPARTQGEFHPTVPLEETLLLALGRMQDPRAVGALRDVLRDRGGKFRAIACLALGLREEPDEVRAAIEVLVPFLLDPDPFCRLSAAESLRNFHPEMPETDWMYAEAAERFDAAEEVLAWSLEQR